MKTSDFDYDLPKESIAQRPARPRDSSRLMRLERSTGKIDHYHTRDLPKLLNSNDLLVVNETRVASARLIGHKDPTGGRVELLLLRRDPEGNWESLVGGRNLVPGSKIILKGSIEATIGDNLGGALRKVSFSSPIDGRLEEIGSLPLPPYIKHPLENPADYQTIYSSITGSAAAPTAGLHFTPALLRDLEQKGVPIGKITLHIGLDTFAPVQVGIPDEHPIHSEWCYVPLTVVSAVENSRANGGRVIAVGTTTVRALETAALDARHGKLISEYQGQTELFILPGFDFRIVDAMMTNFHLPRSTLLMMVSAFAGRESILESYESAIESGYRFYSFGDAMLIL